MLLWTLPILWWWYHRWHWHPKRIPLCLSGVHPDWCPSHATTIESGSFPDQALEQIYCANKPVHKQFQCRHTKTQVAKEQTRDDNCRSWPDGFLEQVFGVHIFTGRAGRQWRAKKHQLYKTGQQWQKSYKGRGVNKELDRSWPQITLLYTFISIIYIHVCMYVCV